MGTEKTYDLDWMISVDDHVVEPPTVWTDRLPKKYHETGPHIVRDGSEEYWSYEGGKYPMRGTSAAAGKKYEEITPHSLTFADMRPGCYDPVARLADMNEAGVIASLNFPTFPRFCGQAFMEAKDLDLGLLCVKAWNDWMLDEWCGSAPGRYIPATLIPLWDTSLAVAEIERCVEKGSRGIIFSENPNKLFFQGEKLPSIHDKDRHWDPVFQAVADADIPIVMHYGSSSSMERTSDDAPYMVSLASNTFILPISSTIDWIFSGVLGRFPSLKICMSESQIGWVAPVLERCEYVYKIQRFWDQKYYYGGTIASHQRGESNITERETILDSEDRTPTQIFKDQIFTSFYEDFAGVKSIADLGALDNILIEMDYPHTDSTWPDSIKSAREQVAVLTPAEQYQVLQGNAMKLHRFQPAQPPSL